MSSQDAAKPLAGIDSLSKELLHRLVALVDQQDRAVAESGVSLASKAPSTASGSDVTKLPKGKLSWWYAHGVSALSLVNKRLREVALPLLCRSIKATQLSKPIFQFGRIPTGLLTGIETLDFTGADLDSYAAATIALDRLKNIRQCASVEAVATKIALPHLEVLELSGYPSCAKALSSFEIPALKKLELSITKSQSSALDCASCLPADWAPPAGLDFHLATHRLITLDTFDALEDRCTAQGMHFSHRYLAVLAPFEPRSTDVAEPVDEPSEARKEALLETISWAEEHLEKVWDEGDVQGLQELAEALKMVAQRKQLDTL